MGVISIHFFVVSAGDLAPVFNSEVSARRELTVQGHPTDRFGGISVRKTCNRLELSVREM